METVSVIIPTWNRAATIVKAVRSALEQSHPVTEVLVCDDGSTDETKELLAAIIDPRVRIIEGPRAGRPAIPRNRGITQAKGEWIAFLDSDDAWLPEKIGKQIAAVKKPDCKASCTNAYRVLPGKGRVSPYLEIKKDKITFDDLIRTNFVICSSAMIHRSVLEKIKGFPEDENLKAIEDYALWLRVATLTDFAFIAEPVVDYTDDALNSIRAEARENVQREAVMRNFFEWSAANHVEEEKSKKIKKALRLAMKNNGRSFYQRLTLKA